MARRSPTTSFGYTAKDSRFDPWQGSLIFLLHTLSTLDFCLLTHEIIHDGFFFLMTKDPTLTVEVVLGLSR